MKVQSFWLLILLLFVGGAMGVEQGKITGGKMSEHPDWFKESFLDIVEDVAEAADEDKHVILFMHLNGCPYCFRMTEENFKHAPYTPFIQEHFDVIALNIKGDREVALNEDTSLTEKQLAEKLNVIYTPTVVFMNTDNQVVARVNGYRSVSDFKHILDYVQQKAYADTKLADYLDAKKASGYAFRDHPQLQTVSDLKSVSDKPLAVLFEDKGCGDCELLHDGYLAKPEVRDVLKNYTFVRLDALSDEPITDVDGNKTTPKAYAAKLGLTYRPGLVLFDKGMEIMRIQSQLYRYHFTEVLRYVGERHYEKYPDSFYDYLDVRTADILASGNDVDLGK